MGATKLPHEFKEELETIADETIVNFEDKEHIKELESVMDKAIEETKDNEEVEAFKELEKDLNRIKELPPKYFQQKISHSDILESITKLSNNISMLINRNTVELNAESANENIIIKKLTSIKGDTLDLNSKTFKIKLAELLLWVSLGICIGFLNQYWLPFVESNLGGVIKWIANIFIK